MQPESFGVESETSVLPENSQANGESELFSQEVEIVEESTAGSEERHTPVIYYIDGLSGNDANSGTAESEAWQSLEKVNATEFGPGDKILFRAGSICSDLSSDLPVLRGSPDGTCYVRGICMPDCIYDTDGDTGSSNVYGRRRI